MAVYLFYGIDRTQQAAFDTSLYNYAVDVGNATDFTVLGQLVVKRDILVEENKVFPFSLGQSLVQIRTLDGFAVVSSKGLQGGRLPLRPEILQAVSQRGVVFETIEGFDPVSQKRGGRGVTYRLVHYLIHKGDVPPLILQVAAPMEVLLAERRQLLSLFWTLIPLALFGAALVGLVTATRALAPMNRIIKSAREMGAQRLSERVPVPEETELRDLALTLNDLLARLQRSFQSQDQFIADASHQLKTPLAIVRGEVDVFMREAQARTPEEARALFTSISQEVTQLSKTVDDLLLLARFDSSQPASLSRIRIDETVLDAISQLSRLAKTKEVAIVFNIADSAADLEINGDFDLLRHLFYNLIENAIKYSPAQANVDVRIANVEHDVLVEIEDRGPGISREDQAKIFDRFYRSGANQHRIPGVGLGLSIAQRIAKFHGADLSLRSQPLQGTTFSLRIKKF